MSTAAAAFAPLHAVEAPADALPFILYLRYSKLGGRNREGLITLDEQRLIGRRLAAAQGVTIGAEAVDEDRSAGPGKERPAFERAMAEVAAGRAAGIIVATFDRFSRDEADTFTLLAAIEQVGGRLLCGDGNVSLATAGDAMQTGIRAVFSAFERRRKAEGMAAAVRSAVQDRGVHLGIPFGYRRPETRGKALPLVIDETEAPTVRLMFRLRAEGLSWKAITRRVNAEGCPPRPHNHRGVMTQALWTNVTIGRIVANDVYLGVAHEGAHRHEGAHPAIIDPETARLARVVRGVKRDRTKDGYMLTGLVRCSGCGRSMISVPNGAHDRAYRCRTRNAGGYCPAPVNVPAEALEAYVARAFGSDLEGLGGSTVEAVEADAAIEQATADMAAKSAAVSALMDMVADMAAAGRDTTPMQSKMDEALQRVESAKLTLRDVKAAQRGVNLPANLDASSFATLPVPEQRHFLSLAYAAVVVRKADSYREPVEARCRILGLHQAPTNPVDLIRFVVGLDS